MNQKKNFLIIILIMMVMMFIVPLISFAQHVAPQAVEGVDFVSRMATLMLQLSIIIFLAWGGAALFEKIHLPGVLGEIIAGVIIGPYMLGRIPLPGFSGGLFPLAGGFPVSDELYAFTTLASIMLLFLAGLETNVKTFLRFSLAGGVLGLCGVVFSFFAGAWACVLFSQQIFGQHYGFMHPVSLFLGIISTATSISITARILSEKKKIDSPEGITIIASAVIDDVIGIILLAIVIGVIKSGHIVWGNIAFIGLKALGMWLGFTVAGLMFAHQLSSILKRFKNREVIAIMSFAGALFLAGIFEKSGLAMIIGAYVMGLSLSKTDLSFVIRERLSVLHRLFVPVFFCVMGMLIDVNSMTSGHIMRFGLIYLLFCVLGKFIGCGLPALFLNFTLQGAMRIGIGMVPRGEVALIIAGIGLSQGIISQDIFGVAVMMTFLTTLITPPILANLLDKKQPVLRKQESQPKEHREIKYAMPNSETTELILSKVLAAFDQEGFYIYCAELPNRLYQIRKDSMVIILTNTMEELIFEAPVEAAVFVHTLFYEVIAEIGSLVRNLESFTEIDKENIGKKIFSGENSIDQQGVADFYRTLSPLAIKISLDGITKTEIINEMVELLVISGQLSIGKRDEVIKDLLSREESMSTGMQDGIALPHAKTPAVQKLIFAIGLKKDGVDFNSLDGKLSRIFVMTLVSKGTPQPYLQFMAQISRILADEQEREKILACESNAALYDFLISKS